MSQNMITSIVDSEDISGLNITPAWAIIYFDNNQSKLVIDWKIIDRLIEIRKYEEENAMDNHDRTKCPKCENCITNLREDKLRLEKEKGTLIAEAELDNTSIMLLQSKIKQLREALMIVEWDEFRKCKKCKCFKCDGHSDDCPIGNALKE